MTDMEGNPLTAADADGNAVTTGIVDLGNGMSQVTYGTVTESPVSYSVASTLDSVMPKLVHPALRSRCSGLRLRPLAEHLVVRST